MMDDFAEHLKTGFRQALKCPASGNVDFCVDAVAAMFSLAFGLVFIPFFMVFHLFLSAWKWMASPPRAPELTHRQWAALRDFIETRPEDFTFFCEGQDVFSTVIRERLFEATGEKFEKEPS